MRRAVYLLLLVGSLAGVAAADEPLVYRGQTAAQWLQQLSHPSASARAAAAQAFVTIGKENEDAVEPLIGLLSDYDRQVRFYAAYALGKIEVHDEQCIAALIKALPDKGEHVRYTAQWSLAQIARRIAESNDGNAIADDSLAKLLADAETELLVAGALPGHLQQVRAAIARFDTPAPQQVTLHPPVFETSDEDNEISRWLKSMESDDLTARVIAIERLRQLGPNGVQKLLAAPDSVAKLGSVGWHLPTVIASLGEPVVPDLITALRHPSDEINELAANALIDLGPVAHTALPELMKLLEDRETPAAVRLRAIGIVKSIGPAAESATDLLVRELNDPELNDTLQASAADALGSIGPAARRAIPALIDRLASVEVSGYVRPAIISALVRIDPKSERVTRTLIGAFQKSEDIYTALGIAENLCECGSGASQIVPQLLAAVEETSFDGRATVLKLLGKLGTSQLDEVSKLLLERLLDPDEELMVRVAAARALGELGPAAVQRVGDELRNGDEANQLIAARTLVEIGAAASPAKEALLELLIERRAENELRALAAVALGQLDSEARGTAPVLTKLLHDPESGSYLRAMCAVALGQVDPTCASTLESMLDDVDAEVQIASAYSLCKMNPRHARGLAMLVQWLESDEYRGSALNALVDVGESSLPLVVEKMKDTSQNRETRLAYLEIVSTFDERAIDPLLHALNDEVLAEEAGWALRDRGNKLIPALVASIGNETDFAPQSRAIMRSVIEDMFMGLGSGDGDETWVGGHGLVKRPEAAYAMEMESANDSIIAAPMMVAPENGASASMQPDRATGSRPPPGAGSAVARSQLAKSIPAAEGYKTVDVFYGTNRKPIDKASSATAGRARWFWLAAIVVLVVIVGVLIGMYRRGARGKATAGLAGLTLILLAGLLFVVPTAMRQSVDKPGPRYGGEYSDRIEMGVCQVTIPNTHREGALEGPTVLRLQVVEDLQKHIVLRSVRRLPEEAFFAGLQKELQSKGNNILVFIHGYNVSFEDAARRTAQMSSDLKFAGAPVFYSWPSQAELLKYRVDEKHVELSVDQLKAFLLAIARDSKADAINLVAHSMGNRALTDALKEMDVVTAEQEQLFNQVILAAPDIDADIFKQRIAPAIVTKAKHITLYASSKDLALVASRRFNSGDPRAGDAGENLVVVPGIETIDVSSGDSSLMGHSYYGDNVSVLRDIEYLLRDQPASSRRFLERVSLHGDLAYWMFQPERIARQNDDRYEMR